MSEHQAPDILAEASAIAAAAAAAAHPLDAPTPISESPASAVAVAEPQTATTPQAQLDERSRYVLGTCLASTIDALSRALVEGFYTTAGIAVRGALRYVVARLEARNGDER